MYMYLHLVRNLAYRLVVLSGDSFWTVSCTDSGVNPVCLGFLGILPGVEDFPKGRGVLEPVFWDIKKG